MKTQFKKQRNTSICWSSVDCVFMIMYKLLNILNVTFFGRLFCVLWFLWLAIDPLLFLQFSFLMRSLLKSSIIAISDVYLVNSITSGLTVDIYLFVCPLLPPSLPSSPQGLPGKDGETGPAGPPGPAVRISICPHPTPYSFNTDIIFLFSQYCTLKQVSASPFARLPRR